MATQIDLYFAEYAIKKGYTTSKQVQECFDLLARLKKEAGVEDTLHGIMMLKGYVTEEEAERIRGDLLSRDIDFPAVSLAPQGLGASPSAAETKTDPRRHRFYMDEAARKTAEGDFEGALNACNKARPYAEDTEEVDAAIRDLDRRIREKDRVVKYRRYQEEVREKASARDFEGALHICRVARGLADDPADVDKVIASLRPQAWKERERHALKVALAGDLEGGVRFLRDGRNLLDDPAAVHRAVKELKHSVDLRVNTDRYLTTAENLEKKGDVVGAAEIIEKLAPMLGGDETFRQKRARLRQAAYDRCMVEARKKEWINDFEGAVEACRRARKFTTRVQALDQKTTSLKRRAQRNAKVQTLQDEADDLLAQGDEKAALEKLKDALNFTDQPERIHERIQRIAADLFRGHRAKADELEQEDRVEEMLAELRAAREFAPDPEVRSIENRITDIEASLEEARKRRKVRELLEEAKKLVGAGEIWRGIDRMTAAKTWAEDVGEIEALIDATIKEQYDAAVGKAEEAESRADLERALDILEGAREWSKNREQELDDRIRDVRRAIREKGRNERFASAMAAAEEALQRGDPKRGVSELEKARALAEDPGAVDDRIREIRDGEKARYLEQARKREEAGDLRGAADAYAFAAAWAEEKEAASLDEKSAERVREAEKREARNKIEAASASASELASENRLQEAVARMQSVRDLDPPEIASRIETLLSDALASLEKDVRERTEEADFNAALKRIEEGRASLGAAEAAWVEERLGELETRTRTARRRDAFEKAASEARALAVKGDERKALLKAGDAREAAEDAAGADAVEAEVRKTLFDHFRDEGETKEKASDLKGAIVAWERAKSHAVEGDVASLEARIAGLNERLEAAGREEEFRRLEKEAGDRLAQGDPGAAIETLSGARSFCEDPGLVDGRIAEIREGEFSRLVGVSEEALARGDLEQAREALESAREWGEGREEEIGSRLREIEAREEEARLSTKIEAVTAEAEALLEAGDRRGALRVMEEARPHLPDPGALGERIEQIRREGKSEVLTDSWRLEGTGDLEGALARAKEAWEWAPDSDAEVAERIAALEASIEAAGKAKEREALEAQGEERIAAGQVQEGLEVLRRAATLAEDPEKAGGSLDARIEKEVDERLASAETQAGEGDFETAFALVEEARAWNPDRSRELEARRESLEERQKTFSRRSEFRRHKAEAERRFADGNVRGAFESLRIAREFAEDPSEVDRRAAEMHEATFETYVRMASEREGRGDLEGAQEAFELAREWAGAREEELDARVQAVRDRIERKKKEGDFRKQEEEAERLLARGYARRAVELFREIMPLAPDAGAVQARIESITEKSFWRHVEEALRAAAEGDTVTAFDWLDRAREWSKGREAELEEKIREIKLKEEAKERSSEYEHLLAEADKLLASGRRREALEDLRKAESLAEDPETIRKRIGDLIDKTFDELAMQAALEDEGGDLEGAMLTWKQALDWIEEGERKSEVEGFIRRLEEAVSEETPGDTLARVGTRVKSLLEEGDIPGALRRYNLASKFTDSPDEARRQVCQIAANAIQNRAEAARESLDEGDWEAALDHTRAGAEVRSAVEAADASVDAASVELEKIERRARFQQLRDEANDKAEKGDVKGALEACREARRYTDDVETLKTVTLSLAESALERWTREADEYEEKGDWASAAKVLLNALDLYTLDEEAVAPIRDRRTDIEKRLRDVQYRRYILAAAEAEAQTNYVNAIEHLKRAGEFSGRPEEIETEIDRVQGLLFEKFNSDIDRVEQEEGVEGAIRFCKAALEYFPDASLCRKKLRDLEQRWERIEKEGEFSSHVEQAQTLAEAGDFEAAIASYRTAAELTDDTTDILAAMDEVIEKHIGSTFREVDSLLKKKNFRAARSLLEIKAREFPESGKIQEKRKEVADAEAETTEKATEEKQSLTMQLWDEVESGEEDDAGPSILTRIWETGEFKAEELFKDGIPGSEETHEPEPGTAPLGHDDDGEEAGLKPLALEPGTDAETPAPALDDEEDILEPVHTPASHETGAPETHAEPEETHQETPPAPEPETTPAPVEVPEEERKEKINAVLAKIMKEKREKARQEKALASKDAAEPPEAEAPPAPALDVEEAPPTPPETLPSEPEPAEAGKEEDVAEEAEQKRLRREKRKKERETEKAEEKEPGLLGKIFGKKKKKKPSKIRAKSDRKERKKTRPLKDVAAKKTSGAKEDQAPPQPEPAPVAEENEDDIPLAPEQTVVKQVEPSEPVQEAPEEPAPEPEIPEPVQEAPPEPAPEPEAPEPVQEAPPEPAPEPEAPEPVQEAPPEPAPEPEAPEPVQEAPPEPAPEPEAPEPVQEAPPEPAPEPVTPEPVQEAPPEPKPEPKPVRRKKVKAIRKKKAVRKVRKPEKPKERPVEEPARPAVESPPEAEETSMPRTAEDVLKMLDGTPAEKPPAPEPAPEPEPRPEPEPEPEPEPVESFQPIRFKVTCPNPACGKSFTVKGAFAGKKGKCPACKGPVEIPRKAVKCSKCGKKTPVQKAVLVGKKPLCMDCAM